VVVKDGIAYPVGRLKRFVIIKREAVQESENISSCMISYQ